VSAVPIACSDSALTLSTMTGVASFMRRIGDALGLSTTPCMQFHYSRFDPDDDITVDEIADWDTYPIMDQLAIMAKLVFSFQHREIEPSFTIMLQGNHIIAVECKSVIAADQSRIYRFSLTLNIVTSYGNTRTHTPHALKFIISPEVQNPFHQCEFVWAGLVT
jgi:hypothetical protein